MKRQQATRPWKVLSRFVEIRSPWATFIGEKLQDTEKHELEYWRAEKPHGVLVITKQGDSLILPAQMYRPGIGEYTLDFCGGRLPSGTKPSEAAIAIVQRELKLAGKECIIRLEPINKVGWNVDSSFTNVKLYGFIAELSSDLKFEKKIIADSYKISQEGISSLLDKLICLQCRALLLDWHSAKNKK